MLIKRVLDSAWQSLFSASKTGVSTRPAQVQTPDGKALLRVGDALFESGRLEGCGGHLPPGNWV